MISRRQFLTHAGAVSLAGVAASLSPIRSVKAADYKALVIVFLSGGHDGNNILIPTDAAYSDYSRARTDLALVKDSLVPLSGSHIGHKFALAPSARAFADLFEQRRLAVIANVGALVQPITVAQVLNRTATLPPFLGSHQEQSQWIQGWMGDEDQSGWGGRLVDLMPAEWTARQPLVSMGNDNTAVLPNEAALAFTNSRSSDNWGRFNLLSTSQLSSNRLEWATRMQSGNAYEQEFARSLRSAYTDSIDFALGQQYGPTPSGTFPDVNIGRDLRYLAKHIPYSVQQGARRQIFLVQDGGYDTHADQLSSTLGLDFRVKDVADSVSAFDMSMRSAGLDGQVLTVVISEFGRTLDPAGSGTRIGTDHAWGNHWFAIGGAVRGGLVHGQTFPNLVKGGPDDVSFDQRGYWLPQYSSDQFVADIALWMGMTVSQAVQAMPNLANFSTKTVGYL
jgi:uncharacterized protein (DUF1501 family)